MPPTPLGWRRLWPSPMHLQTIQLKDGRWNWRIWDARKTTVLAIGAESYGAVKDALRGGLRFWEAEAKLLYQKDAEIEKGNTGIP